MPSITVRNLDPALQERLRERAAKHGRSLEQEVRNILESALPEPLPPPPKTLYQAIRDLVEPHGGFELELPAQDESANQQDESKETPAEGLGTAIHNLFKPLGGVELELPPREKLRLDRHP